MHLPTLMADWHGVPDGWIAGVATAAATGIGWLVKHVTTRSAERAAAMQTTASHNADSRVQVQIRAFDTLENLVKTLQGQVQTQSEKTERLERDYGERLAKLERRNGRMNHFIVKLLDAYLQIKAYVPTLEALVVAAHPAWKCRTFPEIELPTFDDDTSAR